MVRRSGVWVVVCALVSLILVVGGAFAAEPDDPRKIVMFLDGVPLDVQKLLVTLTGSTVVHVLSLINALAIQLPPGGIDDILESLLDNPAVLGVFDDPIGSIVSSTLLAEAYTGEGFDWGLARIGVPEAQSTEGVTGSGVTVAVLDTGIDSSHPDLSGKVVSGFNALPGGGSYKDNHGHGTHMAGIIAAAVNSKGIIGAAPKATLSAVKVLDKDARGRVSDLINGLQWAQKKGIRVANLSLGFSEENIPLERAIERLYQKGMIMVAAAGNCNNGDGGGDEGGDGGDEGEGPTGCNSSQTSIKYPAAYFGVIAVAATDHNDQVAYYSLSGPEVVVAAPGGKKTGEQVLSTARGGGYALGSGTSQATAHVSGAVALALQRNPKLNFEQTRDLIEATAEHLGYPATQQGAGLIDVQRMLGSLE
jgi:subtilisin family serine protease